MTINDDIFRECRAILFDYGGTLDSDGEHWLDRFYQLYRDLGLDLAHSEIKRAFYHADGLCYSDPKVSQWGLRPLMEHHVRLQFETLSLSDDVREREMAERFCSHSEHGMRQSARILALLRGRYRLGLVSNFYGDLSVLCREAGFSDFLDVLLDSGQTGVSKPEPEIFQMALRELELHPGQVIFVGDSYERDMIPAGEAGMKTIWLKGPHPRIPLNAGPVDATISTLSELRSLVS